MSDAPTPSGTSPDALRREFDAAFAAPPRPADRDLVNLLGVPIAKHAYALRVHDLIRLEVARRIVPVPGRSPALLGLAGLRGQLVPVFSLTVLLGHPRDAQAPRWFAVHGGDAPVALALEACSGFQAVPRADVSPVEDPSLKTRHVVQAARVGPSHLWIIDVDSLLKSLRSGTDAALNPKEAAS